MGFATGYRASIGKNIQAQATAAFCPEAAEERTIFLLDYDSYFARCMQQAYPPLRGKPVGIRGPAKGTAIIAASTEAKKRGVKVGMHINEALRHCPQMIAVHADMDMYGEVCTKSLRVLTSYTDKVEPFSIDESYMDVTDLVEEFGDVSMLAQDIKHNLRAQIGATITCSIGIGPNKMIAKLISSFHKPDGITTATPAEIPALLKKIALADICGIGPRVERRLQRMGIYTIEQLGRFPREGLVREFGVLGNVYWLWGQGIDLAPVEPYHGKDEEKSMGHGVTLPSAVGTRGNFDGVLLRLCERVGRRLRRRTFQGKTVHLFVGYDSENWQGPSEGFGGRRSLIHYSDNSLEFYQAAQSLMPGPGLERPVRRVHVCVSHLRHNALQLSLLEDRIKQRHLQEAMDNVNDRFGEFTVMRGKLLLDTFPLRGGPPGHGLCKRFAIDE
ncbi:MAG: Y-family DNA polymerase [Armatimonadota bacterium]